MPPRREEPTSRTTITLPEDVRRAIDALAAKNDRNLSAEITRALREYIQREGNPLERRRSAISGPLDQIRT